MVWLVINGVCWAWMLRSAAGWIGKKLAQRVTRRQWLEMQAACVGVRARWWQSERSIRRTCEAVIRGHMRPTQRAAGIDKNAN